ncbi:hypothetical protein EJ05DRAFT_500079 [Pseudovirgaria hyperparasitica]|uniref:Uncharacterized protein n=1 Tax=Pseudovirgaria hyperparasitica TaxID=470096 RepID=A0A6A6W9E2_9PEZI|nr:uncharacterized protein EJ05DRAFT_500079 [Pseudovirgaria hyperparasitica]KAF2758560.1 hypothetical protein EJ05DRAFT_500079 [Pseudovirgaria hyperparasitica]
MPPQSDTGPMPSSSIPRGPSLYESLRKGRKSSSESRPPMDDFSQGSSPSFMASTKSSRSGQAPVSKLPRRIPKTAPSTHPSRTWANAARKVGIRRPSFGRKDKVEESSPPSLPRPPRPVDIPHVASTDRLCGRTVPTPNFAYNKPLPTDPPPYPPPDKPLPSVPIAVVHRGKTPTSRTLLDASDRPLRRSPGTPDECDWPALKPESSQSSLAHMAGGKVQSQVASFSSSTASVASAASTNHNFENANIFHDSGSISEAGSRSTRKDGSFNSRESMPKDYPPPIPPRGLYHRANFSRSTSPESSNVQVGSKQNSTTNFSFPKSSSAMQSSTIPALPSGGPLYRKPMPSTQLKRGIPVTVRNRTPTVSTGARTSSIPSLRKASSASFRSQNSTGSPSKRISSSNGYLRDKARMDQLKECLEPSTQTANRRGSVSQQPLVPVEFTTNVHDAYINIEKVISSDRSHSNVESSRPPAKRLARLSTSSTVDGIGATLTISEDADSVILGSVAPALQPSEVSTVPECLPDRRSTEDSQNPFRDDSASSTSSSNSTQLRFSMVHPEQCMSNAQASASVCENDPVRGHETRKRFVSVDLDSFHSNLRVFALSPPRPVALLEQVRLQDRANALFTLEGKGRASTPTEESSSSSYPSSSYRSTSPHANLLLGQFVDNPVPNKHFETATGQGLESELSLIVPEEQHSKISQSTAPTSFASFNANQGPYDLLQAPQPQFPIDNSCISNRSVRTISSASSHATVHRRQDSSTLVHQGQTNAFVRHPIRSTANQSLLSKGSFNNDRASHFYDIPRMASSTRLCERTASRSPSKGIRTKMTTLRNLFHHKRDNKSQAKNAGTPPQASTQTGDRQLIISSSGSPMPVAFGPPRLRVNTTAAGMMSISPRRQTMSRLPVAISSRIVAAALGPNRTLYSTVNSIIEQARESPSLENTKALAVAKALTEVYENTKAAAKCLEEANLAAQEAKANYEKTECAARRITTLIQNTGGFANLFSSDMKSKPSRR